MRTVLVAAAALGTGFISDKTGGTNSVTPSDEPGTMTAQMLTRAGSGARGGPQRLQMLVLRRRLRRPQSSGAEQALRQFTNRSLSTACRSSRPWRSTIRTRRGPAKLINPRCFRSVSARLTVSTDKAR